MRKGDVVRARVVAIKENGVYLEKGDLSGYINVTQLSWEPGTKPEEVAQEGEFLDVLVDHITTAAPWLPEGASHGFYASLKALDPRGDPYAEEFVLGARHEGRVWKRADYGFFVRLESRAIGLIRDKTLPLAVGDPIEVEVAYWDKAIRRLEFKCLRHSTL